MLCPMLLSWSLSFVHYGLKPRVMVVCVCVLDEHIYLPLHPHTAVINLLLVVVLRRRGGREILSGSDVYNTEVLTPQ